MTDEKKKLKSAIVVITEAIRISDRTHIAWVKNN